MVFLLDIHGSQDNRTWGSLILTLLYHFQPLHEYFGIDQLITAEISPLLIASNRIQSRQTMKLLNSLRPRGTAKKIRSYKITNFVPLITPLSFVFVVTYTLSPLNL